MCECVHIVRVYSQREVNLIVIGGYLSVVSSSPIKEPRCLHTEDPTTLLGIGQMCSLFTYTNIAFTQISQCLFVDAVKGMIQTRPRACLLYSLLLYHLANNIRIDNNMLCIYLPPSADS